MSDGRASDVAQREHDSDRDADLDGDDEIERDGRHGGEHHHKRVGTGGAQDRTHIVHVDHPHRGHHQHTGERGDGDLRDEPGRRDHDHDECERMDDRGQTGTGTGTYVDRSAGDRTGGGHAAEQRRHDVREPLPDELAIRVVTADVAHPVRDLGREQTLDRGQERDRDRRTRRSATDHRGADRPAWASAASKATHRSS